LRSRIPTLPGIVTHLHILATMGEEKVRISGEVSRPADAPVLPTVNPDLLEKAQPKLSDRIPAPVYVMWVSASATPPSAS
jgi:Mg-chelatase subunit ChlI